MLIYFIKNYCKFLILSIALVLSFLTTQGQIYGLYFSGNEVSKDLRTGLDLTHYRPFKFQDNIDLIFDLKLSKMDNNEFGYIVRITSIDNNVDLIYNRQNGKNEIVLVKGQDFSDISYDIELNRKNNVWIRIQIHIDLKSDNLTISIGDKVYQTKNIGFKKPDHFNVNFGAVLNGKYAMTHVPPMSIRGIKIFENSELSYEWPLDESEGEIATDKINLRKAFITNPSWLIKKHYLWENVHRSVIKGKVSIAYESIDDKVIIVDQKQLTEYSIRDKSVRQLQYIGNKPTLIESGNSICIPNQKYIYSISIPEKRISKYNSSSGSWDNETKDTVSKENAIHYNKFYSSADNKILIVGGYASNTYKNDIISYDLTFKKWMDIKPLGDFYGPRFLAALGTNQTFDTAYILGGYGSKSGNSILDPHYYYDLFSFSTIDNRFRKIHSYSESVSSFTFANSLIVDNNEKCFYALRFSLEKFIGDLQLVKGSFNNPNLTEMASKIPFIFQEKRSYADLFYCKLTQQLIAVTVFYNQKLNESEVNIYTINSPPNISNDIIHQNKIKGKALYWIILLIIFDSIIFFAYIISKKLKARKKAESGESIDEDNYSLDISYIRQINSSEKKDKKNSIFLFGGFQVFDSEGNEISKMFTPLLKELFLIIVFYTYKNGKGIQSSKLTEMLWFDKTQEKAINNRSVNIGKLRNLLNLIGDCELSNKTVYWTIDFGQKNTPIYFDFWEYKYLINQPNLDKAEVCRLISIISKGALLPFNTYSWLDDFKEDISSKIIDKLLVYSTKPEYITDKELIIHIANSILIFDSVNEDAVKLKCNALISLGKHSLAKNTYDKFVNEYYSLYLTPFERSFKELTDK